MSRNAIGTWLKYASFEEAQRDFERARSVYERALDVDHRNSTLWLKYAEMEMRNRHINAARNVWDRAVTLMPRVDQFWFKYIYMEEMLGNVSGARAIFDRWTEWEPDDHAWTSYVRLELRANQPERARGVFERYVQCHNLPKGWIKWAKFEEKQAETARCREVFERALQELDERDHTEEIFIAFAQFEERAKEAERARAHLQVRACRPCPRPGPRRCKKYVQSPRSSTGPATIARRRREERAAYTLPKSQAQELYKKFVQFEKQRGDREGIEDVILSKRRFEYEEAVRKDAYAYDTWFDYLKLEESAGDVERTRQLYERAIANYPPAPDKRLWRRYVYFWLKYAIFEELVAEDAERARAVLAECRRVVPHGQLTFAKVWVHAALLEVRQGKLAAARKLFGQALGRCPKEKLFKEYVQLELQLGEVPRCRQVYLKYLEWDGANCAAWIAYAELEASLGELDRCRSLFELAIAQPSLDMPETLWKAYIDFEIGNEEWERTRALYRALLERSKHPKVWVSFAQFERRAAGLAAAAEVYAEAEAHCREAGLRDERALLLESWRELEAEGGDADRLAAVEAKQPKRLKKKRAVVGDDGEDGGWEEYVDYVFPEEQSKAPSLKILEMAQKWKKQKTGDGPAGE